MIQTDYQRVEENKRNCSWFLTYGIVPYLAQLSNAKSILEIGVAYGYHAEFILNNLPNIKYIGVDPYLANYDPNDIFSSDVQKLMGESSGQMAMDRLHLVVSKKLENYGDRAKLIRRKSEDAANLIPDDSLDLIYIDGDHTYEGVIKDLNSWWKKVNQKTGLICGDDISWSGVKNALDDFFRDKKIEYRVISKNGFENLPVWYYDFSQKIK